MRQRRPAAIATTEIIHSLCAGTNVEITAELSYQAGSSEATADTENIISPSRWGRQFTGYDLL